MHRGLTMKAIGKEGRKEEPIDVNVLIKGEEGSMQSRLNGSDAYACFSVN